MTRQTSILTAFLIAAGALAASSSGCELITSVDRSKIPSTGGSGGSTTTTSTTDTTTTSTSSSSCAGGAMACTSPSDCPAQTTACLTNTCTGGCCGTAPASNTTACTDNGGKICDGAGKCVACAQDSDCPASGTACEVPTCDTTAHTCSTKHASNTTACTDNGGKVCDGSGACVKCNQDSDCPATGTTCATPKCDTTAHTCSNTDAAKGTACTDNGGVVCDGSGACVTAHCADGAKDADETDVDCGGSCTAKCADTKGCMTGADCQNKVCDATAHTCTAASCTDNVQNGDETDKDCGGSCTTKCADKLHCSVNADCANNLCFGSGPGTCVSCADGVKDGNETDVDCGGAQCDAQNKLCGVNKGCGGDNDCQSNNCASNTCQLKGDGATCTNNNQCTSTVCGPAGTGNCCTAACTTGACGATSCNGTGACVYPGNTTSCGTATCSGSTLTPAGTCSGSGTCTGGTAAACPNGLKCGSATACLTACASDNDCADPVNSYCSNPGASGTCVAKGAAGATCTGNGQCSSSKCGTTGTGTHCCTASCPATVAACGATDCNGSGACVYPGNTVAPASLQTPGDCQKIVCNGSGGTTSADDVTDIPTSNTVCLINPACQGTPAAPHFDPAPTGTDCTADGQPPNHVCGDTSNSNIAGTCVQCNNDADCVAIGKTTCNTSNGTCS